MAKQKAKSKKQKAQSTNKDEVSTLNVLQNEDDCR